MNWGKSIILAFILFAIFIGVLVMVCVRQDINLVSKNYYQEELRFGDHMQQMANAEGLTVKPEVNVNGGSLVISYDDFAQVDSCEIRLLRPSDSRQDRQFTIKQPGNRSRSFDIGSMLPGMYRVRLSWSMKGKNYFTEKEIII